MGQLEADEIGVGVTPSGNPLEVAGTNGNFSIAADGNTANFSRNAANYIAATADTSSSLVALAKHSFQIHTGNPTVEALRVDSSQRVGIGTASPSATVEVTDATTNVAAVRVTRRSDLASTYLEIGTTGGSAEVRSTDNLVLSADLDDNGGDSKIEFKVDGSEKWTINASGNLVANSTGIDFGSTNTASGVTVNGSVMSEYEVGTWTPSFTTTGSGFTTPPTMDVLNARYVRVGDMVTFTCYVQTDSVDLTGAGVYLLLNGLPYAASASSGYNYSAVNVGFATRWANVPAGGYIQSTTSFIYLAKRTSSVTGDFTEMSPSDLTAGTTADQNRLMISGSYVIA